MSENEQKKDVVVQAVTESPSTETSSPQTVTVDSEAQQRQGVKEAVTNSEAMAVEKNNSEPSKVVMPSFFIKKSDRHRVEVDILSSKKDGRIMSVSRTGLGLDFDKDFAYLNHVEAWFEFSVPNYEDMTTYRQRSSSWRRDAQQTVVDKPQLRNHLLVWHLKDWSLTDDSGNKVALSHEDSGALTDESLGKVYAVNPTLFDVVLTLLEKDILLT